MSQLRNRHHRTPEEIAADAENDADYKMYHAEYFAELPDMQDHGDALAVYRSWPIAVLCTYQYQQAFGCNSHNWVQNGHLDLMSQVIDEHWLAADIDELVAI